MRSNNLTLVFILCFLKVSTAIAQDPDPCAVYKRFRLPHQRLTTYNATTTLSDRFIQRGWYAEPEFIIPTANPGNNHCGTNYPIYLHGSVTEGIKNLDACIDTSTMCGIKIPIQAKYCNSKLIAYNIERPSISNAAYCLAPSANGSIPAFSTTTTVSYVLETSENTNQFRFYCNFTENNMKLFYRADWYVNGIKVFESSITNFEDTDMGRTLTDAMLEVAGITSLGFDIYCEIRASYDLEGPVSLPSKSIPVFMGIEVLTPVLSVREGQRTTIQIRPTSPFGCMVNTECSLDVTADIPEPDDPTCAPALHADGSCGVKLYSSRWNEIYVINIIGQISEGYGGETATMKITLRTNDYHIPHNIWGNQTLQTVTVHLIKNTTDINNNFCKVCCEPHLKRFDISEDILLPLDDTFILFRQENIEVQFQSTTCNIFGHCVCGVVIRVGKAVFIMNHCDVSFWEIQYLVCDNDSTVLDVRTLHNSEYTIQLPTGTRLEIAMFWDEYLNIHVYPSVIDIGKTTGICGPITGNKKDIFTLKDGTTTTNEDDFFYDWSVNDSENLFNSSNRYTSFRAWNTNYHPCKCNATAEIINTEIMCEATNTTQICFRDDDHTVVKWKMCTSPKLQRRFVPNVISRRTRPRRNKRDLSWKNGWTVDSSREYCENLFNSSNMVNTCKDIPGVDVTIDIGVCIQDIQISGSNMFSLAALSSVGTHCLRETQMNRTLWQPDKKHGYKSVFEMVREVVCPGQCSDRGRCVKGVCVCNPGFISADCSVVLNKAPLAVGLDGDGYCDVVEDRCDEIAVFGGTFVEYKLTRCQLSSFQIQDSGLIVAMNTETVIPVVESDGEVTCPLPLRLQKRSNPVPTIDEAVTGYRVSVSNNGVNYSEELTMVIINSECMNCNISGENSKCSFLPNYCIINNQCFNDGAPFSINPDYICRANAGIKFWEKLVPPSIESGETDVTLIEGFPVLFECKTSGNPSPSVVWKKDNIILDVSEDRRYTMNGTGSLIIDSATLMDAGKYTCLATNSAGSTSVHFSLTVPDKVDITSETSTLIAIITSVIACVVLVAILVCVGILVYKRKRICRSKDVDNEDATRYSGSVFSISDSEHVYQSAHRSMHVTKEEKPHPTLDMDRCLYPLSDSHHN